MKEDIVYRALKEKDLSQMHRSFLEAFSTYQVNMKMSKEAFEDRMLNKLNIQFDLSPAIFSGDKLIGFLFQMVNNYEGQLCAYNGGTGIIPGYRGQGFAASMYDYIMPTLKEKGVKKCVLEVLNNNKTAIRAYEHAGFEQTKDFQCLMLKDGGLIINYQPDFSFTEVQDFSFDEYQELLDIQPSMLDQLSQIRFHLSKEKVIEYRVEKELLAYIIFQPANGRIAQIAVRASSRNQGIGRALVQEAYRLSESKKLSILNIETKEEGMIRFFIQLGFVQDLKQLEMQKVILNA